MKEKLDQIIEIAERELGEWLSVDKIHVPIDKYSYKEIIEIIDEIEKENSNSLGAGVSPEILQKLIDLVRALTEQKLKYCNHLCIDNFASELLEKLLCAVAKYCV